MARTKRSAGYRAAQVMGWLMLASALSIVALLAWSGDPECLEPSPDLVGRPSYAAPPCSFVDERSLYEAKIQTTDGAMEVVLAPHISPTAVNAFIFLAIHGWYDGTVFHRIEVEEDHAYAQGGAANLDGTGHAGFLIEDYDKPSPILAYRTGAVAGLVDGDPPKLGSQFFIVGKDWDEIGPPNAYPKYPLLGHIYDLTSLSVLERIVSRGSASGEPSDVVRIVRVDVVRIDENEEEIPVTPSSARGPSSPSPSGS